MWVSLPGQVNDGSRYRLAPRSGAARPGIDSGAALPASGLLGASERASSGDKDSSEGVADGDGLDLRRAQR
jgi:hypothetical protein